MEDVNSSCPPLPIFLLSKKKKKKKKNLRDKWEAIKLANELNDIRVIRIKTKKILQNDLRPL